jgi:hypothetical protein
MNRGKFRSLGTVNRAWGVCGFTSACYALYATRQRYRRRLINRTDYFSMLATIKAFLRELQASGETQLLREIEEFNGDFPESEGFTIQGYLDRIDVAASLTGEGATVDIKDDAQFGLAMPPEGVAKYLQTWGFETTVINVPTDSVDPGGDAIIGVNRQDETRPLTRYDRLCHWMYRYDGKIYSWGEKFNSVKAARSTYEVCWVIQMRRPAAAKRPRIVEPWTM